MSRTFSRTRYVIWTRRKAKRNFNGTLIKKGEREFIIFLRDVSS
jgi:hypothetical protein